MLVSDTTPYAWPFDGLLERSRCALLICGSGSAWSQRCPVDTVAEANIERLRSTASAAGVVIVLLRHHNPARVEMTDAPCSAPLERRSDESEVEAVGIDGFYGSSLDALLRSLGRDQLFFAGRGFETTVHSTVRRANDRGYECLTIADACAPIHSSMRTASISTIEMSGGIFGAVGTTEALITALTLFQPEASS